MRKFLLGSLLLLIIIPACKKDKQDFVTGRVIMKSGCLADSWVINLDHPDSQKDFYLCEFIVDLAGYNCNNSIIMSLPASLATPNARIKFKVTGIVPSCLSSSTAPKHVTVKSLGLAD